MKKKEKTAGRGNTPMDEALKFLEYSARTKREVERRLDSLEFGEGDVMLVMNRLEELGLVNDAAYCRDFVDARLRTKPVSRRHLFEQLMRHEADRDAIDAALSGLPDDAELENAVAVAEKYLRQLASLEPELRRERVLQRLAARGFAYDVASKALLAAETDDGEEEAP